MNGCHVTQVWMHSFLDANFLSCTGKNNKQKVFTQNTSLFLHNYFVRNDMDKFNVICRAKAETNTKQLLNPSDVHVLKLKCLQFFTQNKTKLHKSSFEPNFDDGSSQFLAAKGCNSNDF